MRPMTLTEFRKTIPPNTETICHDKAFYNAISLALLNGERLLAARDLLRIGTIKECEEFDDELVTGNTFEAGIERALDWARWLFVQPGDLP